MDSDFDVDETEWGPDDGEEERVRKDERKKVKQWVKPFKQPVSCIPPHDKEIVAVNSLSPRVWAEDKGLSMV